MSKMDSMSHVPMKGGAGRLDVTPLRASRAGPPPSSSCFKKDAFLLPFAARGIHLPIKGGGHIG